MTTRKVRIDAASVCQLRCPRCVTGLHELGKTVGSGVLEADDFRSFLELHPEVREIELSSWGEIFLNPDLSKILEIAHEHHVALTAKNGVNLNTASEEVLEDLVRFRFEAMTLSIDGATQENYSKYRVRGDLDQVLENVRTINRFKAKYRSSYPLLTWKFILFGHNQHEVADARRMAEELGMVFYPDVNWDPDYAPLTEPEAVQAETGVRQVEIREQVEETGLHFTKNWCLQLWNEPQVNWDGKVLGCCINTWGDFGGNAFRDSDALESERLSYAKKMLEGEAPERDDVPCATCLEYKAMKKAGIWIQRSEVRRNRRIKRLKAGVHVALGRRVLQPGGNRLLSWAAARAKRR